VIISQEERIQLHWNLSKEEITLGGALTLRAECELISRICGQKSFHVFVTPGTNSMERIERLFFIVFNSSFLTFKLSLKAENLRIYPDNFLPEGFYPESFSTLRLFKLWKTFDILPSLSWDVDVTNQASQYLEQFANKYVLVSLKNFKSDFPDSNARLDVWITAMRKLNGIRDFKFLIVGEDNLSEVLPSNKFIVNLQTQEIGLKTQLAIISRSQLFIGTASGMATPAILGSNPYTIYKHPKHHVDSIKQEVVGNRFPFAQESQNIQICIPTADQIVADTLKQLDNLEL
jgi:hypothetical protein